MMKIVSTIFQLPSVPAVYALYGGQNKGTYVAYVGLATKLKPRITQHLVRHDSSITAGLHAVKLNPDYVTRVEWWEHSDFIDSAILAAAELIAFDVLNPVLKSRGFPHGQAKQLYDDESFKSKMRLLFQGEPSGYLPVLSLQEKVEVLEDRVAELEQRIKAIEKMLRP